MSKAFTSIGPHLNASRSEPIRTQRELDEALIKAQRAESDSGSTDSFRVRLGQDADVKISRKWLRPVAFALAGVLGIGGGYRAAGGDLPVPSLRPVVDSEWKAKVEAHMSREDDGLARIVLLENWSCRFELRFLQQNRWAAKRAGDGQRVYELDGDIDRLQKRRQCE